MDVRKWVQQTAEYGYNSMVGGLGIAGTGVGYVTALVGNLRLFGSTATSNGEQKFDERHYFLVPDSRNDDGYALVVTRCLPDGVPPINDLPKRRVLHLPSTDAEVLLRLLLIRQAQAEELGKPSQGKSKLPAEERRLLQLAASAVLNVFDSALQTSGEANKARLGPEDRRFLEVLKIVAQPR